MVASGEGVQVLFVGEDGRYRCDEGALRRVAGGGGGAARALPVAVVSVAGATRGGKSFLLDFFLRYLRAPEAARRSGVWLGADDEPLTGFNWRGGCDRHTEGILVWSEPIVVDLELEGKNEKVAVVLLDTQGAFDSSSTMRDSTTVFALSTLLSSVQIYNLSQNIKEDDLHYLQLFTEYGKLAREEGAGEPFQELRFLVRDWSFAYDHPYGAEGGQQLLDKRLEIRGSQASELREVRAHIHGAFERVRGFLLPHPGLTVASSPAFSGQLKDISAEFKNALLELVPLLFDSENLTIKRINGQMVTLQDFAEYFKSYVEIFNSDALPTPTTVMQATSAASLEAALSACRYEYSAHMERCVGGAACVPRGAVPRLHAAALLAARHAFTARRTLAAPALVAARLDALLQELDASLADYVAINSGRILEAAARSKAGYEAAMQIDECLADEELTTRHNSAVAAARKAFFSEFTAQKDKDTLEDDDDKHSDQSTDYGDNLEEHEETIEEHNDTSEEHGHDSEELEYDNEDWRALKKELEELLPLHRERNAARVTIALETAREAYVTRMREAAASAPCLHPRSLRSAHVAAAAAAAETFLRAWRDETIVPKLHTDELAAYTKDRYLKFVTTNDINTKKAVEEAINVYNNIMSGILYGEGAGDGRCLHPRALAAQHARAAQAAAAALRGRRDAAARDLPPDHYEIGVLEGVVPLYQRFEKSNEERNKEAVKAAHEYYQSRISPAGGAGAEGVLALFDMDIFARHPRVKNEAIDQFKSSRRLSEVNYPQDSHLEDLIKKIDTSWAWIQLRFSANIATTGIGAFAMVGMMLMAKK